MIKIHWTVLIVIMLCILGIIYLSYTSMVLKQPIPEGGLALLSSIASGLVGYEAGKKN